MPDASAKSAEFRVVIPCCARDKPLLEAQRRTAAATGNDLSNALLIWTDGGDGEDGYKIRVRQEHPHAVNEAWKHALRLAEQDGFDFLFLEPDCVFLRKNALELIEHAFRNGGTPIMGRLIYIRGVGIRTNGVAVYSRHFRRLLDWDELPSDEPFDRWFAKDYAHMLTPTNLIQQSAPTRNMESMENIGVDSAIFHGCKDSSLADLIANKNTP